MSEIDQKGTKPGLISTEEPKKSIVKMRCRAPNCDNMDAEEVTFNANDRSRAYRCTKCLHLNVMDIGGTINI